MKTRISKLFRTHFYNALFVLLVFGGTYAGAQLWADKIIEKQGQEIAAEQEQQLARYKDLVQKSSQNAFKLTEQGCRLLQRNEVDLAIVYLEEAAKRDAKYRDSHVFLAYAYLKKVSATDNSGQKQDYLQKTKAALDKAVELDPIHGFTYQLLASYWEQASDSAKAKESAEKAKEFEEI